LRWTFWVFSLPGKFTTPFHVMRTGHYAGFLLINDDLWALPLFRVALPLCFSAPPTLFWTQDLGSPQEFFLPNSQDYTDDSPFPICGPESWAFVCFHDCLELLSYFFPPKKPSFVVLRLESCHAFPPIFITRSCPPQSFGHRLLNLFLPLLVGQCLEITRFS